MAPVVSFRFIILCERFASSLLKEESLRSFFAFPEFPEDRNDNVCSTRRNGLARLCPGVRDRFGSRLAAPRQRPECRKAERWRRIGRRPCEGARHGLPRGSVPRACRPQRRFSQGLLMGGD